MWPLDWEQSYVVRGTDDVALAQAALRDWLMSREHTWESLDADEARERLDRLAPRVGWWRWNFCQCGDGHRHDLFPADGSGRGNWRGVEFA